MNVVKCINGHFFDGDSYQVCPHCGAPAGMINPSVQPESKEKKRGLFGGHKSKGEYVAPQQPVSYQPVNGGNFGRGNDPTVDSPQEPVTPSIPPEKKKDITLDFWQTSSTPVPVESTPLSGADSANVSPSEKTVKDEIFVSKEKETVPEQAKASEERPTAPTVSLKDAVKQASASSEGKTMSYFSAVTSGGDTSKESQPTSNRPVDPVVGWLVCIHGEHFGESFNIGAGMNSIGRNETNRIVLNRDQSISREKHALITYEPKHRKFYVKPGDSSGLTYLNNEYITETKPIAERDIIELGNSKFIFVPLCCDSFTWEDCIKG